MCDGYMYLRMYVLHGVCFPPCCTYRIRTPNLRACVLAWGFGRTTCDFPGRLFVFFIGASINHKRKPYLLPTYTTYILIPTYPYIDQLQ